MEKSLIQFNADIQTVIKKTLDENTYTNYYFVAKSLGTIALTYLLEDSNFRSSQAIWLTPLLQRDDVYNTLLKTTSRGLCIIGDKDPCYINERFEKIKSNNNLQLFLVEGTDHSLAYENNIIGSIAILKTIINKIVDF